MCFLDINVFMPRTDRCDVIDVGIQPISINPCGVRFYNNETGIIKYIRLRTITTPNIQPQRRIIKADLFTQRAYDAHPIFGGYLVKSFMVSNIQLNIQKVGLNFISFVQYTHIYNNNTVQMVYNTSIIQMGSRKKSEDFTRSQRKVF